MQEVEAGLNMDEVELSGDSSDEDQLQIGGAKTQKEMEEYIEKRNQKPSFIITRLGGGIEKD